MDSSLEPSGEVDPSTKTTTQNKIHCSSNNSSLPSPVHSSVSTGLVGGRCMCMYVADQHYRSECSQLHYIRERFRFTLLCYVTGIPYAHQSTT